jgi:hypothetical protein
VADSVSPESPKREGFLVHLAGHVLIFDKKPAPDFNASAGMRLLAIAIVVEALRLAPRANALMRKPRYFLICQGKLECFKHSSYYLPAKDRIWQARGGRSTDRGELLHQAVDPIVQDHVGPGERNRKS